MNTKTVITEHAKFEAKRRGIDLELVLSMIEHPQQTVPSTRNRSVLQGKYHDKIVNGEMLLGAILDWGVGI